MLGVDSLLSDVSLNCSNLTVTGLSRLPALSDLGQLISLSCTFTSINAINRYSLNINNAYDSVNSMKAMQDGASYVSKEDTFGCTNTVIPAGSYQCNPNNHKTIYREFVIGDANGDAKLDSGVLSLGNFLGTGGSFSQLYAGDANALANAQNVHVFPDSIKGLRQITSCMFNPGCTNVNLCLIPGTYTLVTQADSTFTGLDPGTTNLQLNLVTTRHYSGATAQNMGSSMDTVALTPGVQLSDIDYFSCTDNAVPLGGFGPPALSGTTTTKAIYREFFLKDNALVTISNYNPGNDCNFSTSLISVFAGKASDGLNTLKIQPINGLDSSLGDLTTPACSPLAAGWYTVVAYGYGPNYANPTQNAYLGDENFITVYNAVGKKQQISITITPTCPAPKYNHPLTAAIDTITHAPFLLQWAPRAGSTAAYPVTDTTYNLYTENFNCSIDKPFPSFIKPCDNTVNRVSYYTFQILQESYIQINTQNLWGEVFALDIRKDSAKFATTVPIQPCIQSYGHIELCRLQPGTYTLVMFAGDQDVTNGCGFTTPSIYIDKTGYSRFDHAINAYDFGVIPPDSLFHNGRTGDVNPLDPTRAPSNDFFYCTTGAQSSDPVDADCSVVYTPSIYNIPSTNNHLFDANPGVFSGPKRNLWYSFVIDKPGNIYVKVDPKTSDKPNQNLFAIYKSNTAGSLPLATLASQGLLDSTISQGLTFVTSNSSGGCFGSNMISFYVDPCSFTTPQRYYIIVQNPGQPFSTYSLISPNSQVEVSVLVDSVFALKPKFDHYYQADTIGQNLGPGVYKGATDNFTCASSDPNDPVSAVPWGNCAPKTLWYKFTVAESGYIRYRSYVNGVSTNYGFNDIFLYQQTIPGDSTSKGLMYMMPSGYQDSAGNTWGQQCISPGTYYLLVSGCSRLNEDFQPVIWLTQQVGDFCSNPVVAALNGPGSLVTSAVVDCHTIGTDFGEFSPTLDCPPGAITNMYKTTWFRVDVTGKDTLDVTVSFTNGTNDPSTSDINYRLMTGDCGAMESNGCVENLGTINTYRCLAPGSYFFQVFEPVITAGVQLKGTVSINVSAIQHAGLCTPIPKCLARAQFDTIYNCTLDSAVRFTNSSTYGTNIRYKWEFGNNGDSSNAISPSYFFPVLAANKTYQVKLLVENTVCGAKDSITHSVFVPGRPYVNLGPDFKTCNGDTSVVLNATSFPGATYFWQDGSTGPTETVQQSGQSQYTVTVNYNGCTSIDTIGIYINPITKSLPQNAVICSLTDSVLLSDFKSFNNGLQLYSWSNGSSGLNNGSIFAYTPGLYSVDVIYNGCDIKDSFTVVSTGNLHPLGKDTAVCLSVLQPFILNATVSGATSYQWQDGSSGPVFGVSAPGRYKVIITFANCTLTDSVLITSAAPPVPSIGGKLAFCTGDSTLLDAGSGFNRYLWNSGDTTQTIRVKAAGSYGVTIFNAAGCSAVSPAVQVAENTRPITTISGNKGICNGDSVLLDGGAGFKDYLWSNGLSTQTIWVAKAGKLVLKVTDANSCQGYDSVNIGVSPAALLLPISASICSGKAYRLPSGQVVMSQGTFQDTVRFLSGCDSLITSLNLVVTSPLTRSLDTTLCAGTAYQLPSGVLVNQTGTYRDTLHTLSGCDSLITLLHLNVISPVRSLLTVQICAGSPYRLPSGMLVTNPGKYQDTLRAVLGCDSLITLLDLSVLTPLSNALEISICQGKNFIMPSGRTVNATGFYKDTLKAAGGCDSLITILHLTVVTAIITDSTQTICQGKVFTLPSGRIVSSAGLYEDTLRSVTGCDSLITRLQLSVFNPLRQAEAASICAGAAFTLPSGKVVSTPGTYSDTLYAASGCDSVIATIQLSVIQHLTENKSVAICAGHLYVLPSGRVVSLQGIYQDTVRTVSGCDSMITNLNLVVISPIIDNKTITICAGSSFALPSGKIISLPGLYNDTMRYLSGCDSLITGLTLVVGSPQMVSVHASICIGSEYLLPSGQRVSVPGLYKDTVRLQAGCDSLITSLDLIVISPVFLHTQASICAGAHFLLPSGRSVGDAGLYQDTVRTLSGCDSLITTLQLAVVTPLRVSTNASICAGSFFTLPSGALILNAGIYQDTVRTVSGCDSLITTCDLAVVSPLRVAASASICQGSAYTLPSGRLLTTAGSYQDTLRTLAGCDSLITSLRLAVVVPLSVNTLASICQGSAYSLPSGRVVNLAGTYQDTVRTFAGCDSLITRLSLSIFQKTAATIDTALCAGKTLRLPSGLLLSNTGRYQDTLRSTGGCDSVIYTINLTVNPSPTVDAGPDQAILVGSTLTLQPVASPDVIAWNWQPPDFLSCANCPAPLVTPLSPVTYIVQVTNSEGCSATDTISISLKCSGSVVFIPNTFTPDGDGLNDIFYPRGRGIKRVNYFRVFNRWGELIFEQKNFNIDDRTRGWDGRFNGKYLPPDVFVYTTEMVCDNNETFLLKGTIMIIR